MAKEFIGIMREIRDEIYPEVLEAKEILAFNNMGEDTLANILLKTPTQNNGWQSTTSGTLPSGDPVAVDEMIVGTGTAWYNIGKVSGGTNDVTYVDTIADLTASLGLEAPNKIVIVNGRDAVNDGAGGIFIYDSTLSATNDEAIIINGWVRQFNGAVNAKWFGAIGDGVVDDTVAIQSALSYSDNIDIYLPSGIYKVTDSLNIKNSGTRLAGAGINATKIYNYSSSADGLVLRKDNWADASFISQVMLENFSLYKINGSITGGHGIRETLSSGTTINNVNIYDFPYGNLKEGCVNSQHDGFKILQGTINGNSVAQSYGLKLTSVTLNDTSNFAGYTHRFDKLFITNNFLNDSMDYGIIFEHADVVQIANSYVGGQGVAGMIIKERTGITDSHVTAVHFDNVYFDGVKTDYQLTSIVCYSATNLNVKDFTFDNCTWGQYKTGFILSHDNITNMIINGSPINITDQFLYAQDTKSISVDVNGYNLNTTGLGAATLNFLDCGIVKAKAMFHTKVGVGILLQGAIDVVNIEEVMQDSASTGDQLQSTATITKPLNIPVPIDFTPELMFSGLSTGITYSQQVGKFTASNGIVDFSVYLALSSKGTATGNAKVTIPFEPLPEMVQQVAQVMLNGMSGTVTSSNNIAQTSGTGFVFKYGNGTDHVIVTDVQFTDSSTIVLSGKYII